MQQATTRRDVYFPKLTATIGGRDVEAVSASMERALPDPLQGHALSAASGEIVTAEGGPVMETVATPWDSDTQWPPIPETAASLRMDVGDGPVQLLGGGRVTDAAGGTSGREVTVGVADRYQTLDRTISWDALADRMPGPDETEWALNFVSLGTGSITDTIFRNCGWYCTPPQLSYVIMSAPYMGTTWPETGTLTYSQGASTGGSYPLFARAPWGWAVANGVNARYRSAGAYDIKSRGCMEMVAVVNDSITGTSDLALDVTTDEGGLARLSWQTDSTARIRLPDASGTLVTVVSMPRKVGLLYASIRYVSDTKVEVTLEHAGTVKTVTHTTTAALTTGNYQESWIHGAGSGAGFQVAYPVTPRTLAGWKPNAIIHAREGFYANSLIVRPSVQGENCADLLQAQAEAECATYWIDELGIMHWWDMSTLEKQPNVETLTSDMDLGEDGFQWSHDLSQVKSRVAVKWDEPIGKVEGRPVADVWQGGGVTIGDGSMTAEGWITTPTDEVWIGVDTTMRRASDPDPDLLFNYGVGSWYGGVVDDTNSWAQAWGSIAMLVERVNDAAFKYLITWSPAHPSYRVTLKTPSQEAEPSLWGQRRDMNLPILRASARYELSERVTYSTQRGPATAPERVIDAGWWIQKPEQAEWVADYAGSRSTVPQPVLSSISVIPMPGLQLGDMVTVTDEHITRLTVRGLVISDSRSIDADMEIRQAIAIRPTQVSRNGVTWEEWGRAMASRTWKTWGGQQSGKTWSQWGSAPLDGEGV